MRPTRGRITLEVDEAALPQGGADLADGIARLHAQGFQLSLDGFAMRSFSLAALRQLPFCEIKIDRTLVAECERSRDARAIVQTIVELARDLGMRSCADGVESQVAATLLEQLGCDRLQGGHAARPASAGALAAWSRDAAPATAASPP